MSHLSGDELAPSAFGYNEGQLRFHQSSAYTSLHDIRPAFKAQDRALELCPPNDYTDWSMTRLDRAACLAYDGDTAAALHMQQKPSATWLNRNDKALSLFAATKS